MNTTAFQTSVKSLAHDILSRQGAGMLMIDPVEQPRLAAGARLLRRAGVAEEVHPDTFRLKKPAATVSVAA